MTTALGAAEVPGFVTVARDCDCQSCAELQGGAPQLAASSCTRCATCIAAATLVGSRLSVCLCEHLSGCCRRFPAIGALAVPRGTASESLAPPLLQDIHDEFVAKAAARAQSAEVGDTLDPGTRDTAPAQEEVPGTAHIIMVPYNTLDEVTPKLLAAATQMHCCN